METSLKKIEPDSGENETVVERHDIPNEVVEEILGSTIMSLDNIHRLV
jgi:hypothetical protein